ncbi:ImmA/IrrE family metallo-endopeptidase [Sutcliffiella horikoshii]|uniref:ImmA/IrrE family metallo-endopeptidase n=1 Tax=Sutcliffiella horikoshii TaxID=79883 RepID=UPI003CFB6785
MESITRKVQTLIERYKTNCPFTIAENMGIVVIQENLGNTLGYYNRNFRIKIIHINENTTAKQQAFICSHELGHAILHPDSNTPFLKKNTLFSTERIEVEANMFAVSLLFNEIEIQEPIMVTEAVEEYGLPQNMVDNYLKKNIFLP